MVDLMQDIHSQLRGMMTWGSWNGHGLNVCYLCTISRIQRSGLAIRNAPDGRMPEMVMSAIAVKERK